MGKSMNTMSQILKAQDKLMSMLCMFGERFKQTKATIYILPYVSHFETLLSNSNQEAADYGMKKTEISFDLFGCIFFITVMYSNLIYIFNLAVVYRCDK